MNYPRIFHSCNVLEVAPSKWLISKALISIFFYFWSWFHNIMLVYPPLLLLLYPCKPPYFYYCPLTLLLLGRLALHCGPTRITLWPHGLLYIERRFCKLYHPIIFHLCNVLEAAPSKWLISKALISLFFYFWSWLHNIWYQSFGF